MADVVTAHGNEIRSAVEAGRRVGGESRRFTIEREGEKIMTGKAAAKGVKAKAGRPRKAKAVETTAIVPKMIEVIPQEIIARETALPMNVGVDMQTLMERAIDKMVPLDYMEKLIALIQAQRDRWAKERFFEDLALAQKEFPVVEKLGEARNTDKSCPVCHGKLGDVDKCQKCEGTGHPLMYRYALYEDIVSAIGPIISGHGFSATTKAQPFKNTELDLIMMRATCVLRHRDGHTEETTIEVPIGEGTKMMSPGQKYMAAKTFAKRHAYKDALGVAERGEDVESPDADLSPIASPQPTAGVKVKENGKVADPDAELKAARSELQAVFSKMAAKVADTKGEMVMLYKVEELNTMKEQAKAATADIAKLREYALDWTAGYTERLADMALEGEKK